MVVRPGTEADLAACRELARALARTEPGGLVAPDRWYARRLESGPDEADGDGLDVAVRGDTLVGFVGLGPRGPRRLRVAPRRAAGRRQ